MPEKESARRNRTLEKIVSILSKAHTNFTMYNEHACFKNLVVEVASYYLDHTFDSVPSNKSSRNII